MHWPLLKSIFYDLGNLKYLILTAPTFAETSLKVTKEVVRFSDIIELVGDDTFQKVYNTGTYTDWSKRSNVTW